jgi:hypothetical protein
MTSGMKLHDIRLAQDKHRARLASGVQSRLYQFAEPMEIIARAVLHQVRHMKRLKKIKTMAKQFKREIFQLTCRHVTFALPFSRFTTVKYVMAKQLTNVVVVACVLRSHTRDKYRNFIFLLINREQYKEMQC